MPQDIYDKILMLAKRRGFIYPSFDIYGGVAGFYDYGPLGSQLKNNIENLWRHIFIIKDNCIEINTPTITLYEVLKASGHVDEFTDLTIDCKKCKRSYKVEDIIDENLTPKQAEKEHKIKCPTCKTILKNPYLANLMFQTTIGIGDGRDAYLRPETAQGIFTNFHFLYRYGREKLPLGVIQLGKGYRNEVSPRQGIIRMREFSMAEAEIFFDPSDKTHPNFQNVKNEKLYLHDNKDTFTVTLHEAVQKKIINNEALAYYMYLTQNFLLTAGVNPKKFRFRKHADDELAHYATECWDAELYSERFGWVECVGIADRSAYDLTAHLTASNTDMYALRKYNEPKIVKKKKIVPKMDVMGPLFKGNAGKIKTIIEKMEVPSTKELEVSVDGENIIIPSNCFEIIESEEKEFGEKFVPQVIEPSFGVDRILYFVLEHNYEEQEKKGELYRVLKLAPKIAPFKTGVFPLLSDKELIRVAKIIDGELRENGFQTYYDENGTIGRRYARMDEIGTPFCITVDHETLTDGKITVRNRDTTKQERVFIEHVQYYLKQKMEKKD